MTAAVTRGLSWGLIGASDIAETRMIPAMRRVGHRVSSVVSGTPAFGESFATRNAVPRSHFTLAALLEDPGIDAVYISSRNEHHLEQAACCCRGRQACAVREAAFCRSEERTRDRRSMRRRQRRPWRQSSPAGGREPTE